MKFKFLNIFKFLGFISKFFTFSSFDTTNSCVYFLVVRKQTSALTTTQLLTKPQQPTAHCGTLARRTKPPHKS